MKSRYLPVGFSSFSSCFNLGFEDLGGAFANALMILPEAVRFAVVVALVGGLVDSEGLIIRYPRLRLYPWSSAEGGFASVGLISGGTSVFTTDGLVPTGFAFDAAVAIDTGGAACFFNSRFYCKSG